MPATDLRYPIGHYTVPDRSPETAARLIDEIAEAPRRLRHAVAGLDARQLDTPYREGGWTVRQLAHHVVDSHANAYVRFKLALTEDTPRIKPYDEALWADLPDARLDPEVSLRMLELLHERWVALLRALPDEAFDRAYDHPDNGVTTLRAALGIYAWHGRHHAAHVTGLRERMGW